MNGLQVAFWLCLALVLYTYLGYPLLLALPPGCFAGPCRQARQHQGPSPWCWPLTMRRATSSGACWS